MIMLGILCFGLLLSCYKCFSEDATQEKETESTSSVLTPRTMNSPPEIGGKTASLSSR